MYSGIIVIDKPKDCTSFDVIARLRKKFKMRGIGHSGTLDPMATGVLPVFLGTATKGCEYATAHDKEYVVRFQLGLSTDTQDITGNVTGTSEVNVTRKNVENVLSAFVGEIFQIPPMYSAIKKDGKKLYEYARLGIEVERKARNITIYSANLLESGTAKNEYEARVTCSSGTYIRTLCSDLGDKLGCLAVMTALQRTRSGIFRIENAVSMEQIEQLEEDQIHSRYIVPLDMLFSEYPKLQVDDYGERRIKNGAFVPLSSVCLKTSEWTEENARYRVYSKNGTFLMLGRFQSLRSGGQALFCEKNFFT
ncbi:MAG: tRNA pseudouridine(55) synthase TruB [Clostridiales bacterium]|nr:tRNA pseudouridine(55) synthase TruB [Clostridiales bacterium]